MTLPAPEPAVVPDSGVLRLNGVLRPEARYKALLDVLPDTLVVVFDPKLRVLSIEGGGQARLPFPAAAAIRHRLDEFLTDEQRGRIEPHLQAALRGEPTRYDFAASNGLIWQVEMVPMIDAGGGVAGGIAQFRDVTREREAERALEEHARELERSNAELEQYAYIASHDLSEPLRMINGYLRLLQRRHGDALDEDAQQFVEFALDGALRMRELIDDLLSYSRLALDAGGPRGGAAAGARRGRLAHAHRPSATAPSRRCSPPGLPVVMGDASQLGQVFQNLLSNALKFVEPGRAPVVEVASEPLPRRRLGADRPGRGHRLRPRRRPSGCSACSSACTRATSTRGRASGSPSPARSSRPTAAASGPSGARAAARASASTSPPPLPAEVAA